MFITTGGIVLRIYPFRDKKNIVKIFTEKKGLISCIITKNKAQIPLSQLLTIAEITYKENKANSLFYIKDLQIEYVYKSLTRNSEKIQIAMVLCEVLNKCTNEANSLLYNFIISAFKYLDKTKSVIVGFEALFLIKFCDIFGISPFNNLVTKYDNKLLDIESGCFVDSNNHSNNKKFIPASDSLLLYKLSKINFNELESYNITKPLGLKLFNYMILYISVHLTDLTKLKSIKIINDLARV